MKLGISFVGFQAFLLTLLVSKTDVPEISVAEMVLSLHSLQGKTLSIHRHSLCVLRQHSSSQVEGRERTEGEDIFALSWADILIL